MSSQEQPSQVPITEPITDSFTTSHPTQTPSPMPHDLPLSGGHTPGSDEGNKKLNELTELFGDRRSKHWQAKLKSTRKEKGKDGNFMMRGRLVSEDTSIKGGDRLRSCRCIQRKSKDYLEEEVTEQFKRIVLLEVFLVLLRKFKLQKQLDEREETYNIDWNTIAEQVQERQNMAGYKMGYFKGMSYDEIKPIFEEEYNKIQTLFKKDTEVEKTKTKRIAEETLLQESFKKLRSHLNASRSAEPTEDKERALWVELKRLFKPDKDDVLWKLQRYMYDPLTWRLYGTCGVHHVSSTRGHDIYMLIEKDYPLSTAVMNLMLSRRLQVEEDSEMAKDLIMKIFIEANKLRKMKGFEESSQSKSFNQETYGIWR
ncbi:hypothetical protein Tco_0193716 [Tanacetum coccineum]